MNPDNAFARRLDRARQGRRGVAAFNVIQLEHMEALASAAGSDPDGVILQISENCISFHGGLEPAVVAAQAIARGVAGEVLVHLDHITSPGLVLEGIRLGVDSVMFDASRLPYEENVRLTAELAEACHRADVGVEAELGEIGGKDGAHAPGVRTDPAEAAEFVARTGVDALAVAVGSSHAMRERNAALDLELIGELAAAVPVPLVLHGSSGVDDAGIQAAVRAGISKVNIATHLNGVYTAEIRRVLAEDPALTDPRKYLAPAREAMSREMARIARLVGDPA